MQSLSNFWEVRSTGRKRCLTRQLTEYIEEIKISGVDGLEFLNLFRLGVLRITLRGENHTCHQGMIFPVGLLTLPLPWLLLALGVK